MIFAAIVTDMGTFLLFSRIVMVGGGAGKFWLLMVVVYSHFDISTYKMGNVNVKLWLVCVTIVAMKTQQCIPILLLLTCM